MGRGGNDNVLYSNKLRNRSGDKTDALTENIEHDIRLSEILIDRKEAYNNSNFTSKIFPHSYRLLLFEINHLQENTNKEYLSGEELKTKFKDYLILEDKDKIFNGDEEYLDTTKEEYLKNDYKDQEDSTFYDFWSISFAATQGTLNSKADGRKFYSSKRQFLAERKYQNAIQQLTKLGIPTPDTIDETLENVAYVQKLWLDKLLPGTSSQREYLEHLSTQEDSFYQELEAVSRVIQGSETEYICSRTKAIIEGIKAYNRLITIMSRKEALLPELKRAYDRNFSSLVIQFIQSPSRKR